MSSKGAAAGHSHTHSCLAGGLPSGDQCEHGEACTRQAFGGLSCPLRSLCLLEAGEASSLPP